MDPEREEVRRFIEQYNRTTARHWGVRFVVVDWESYATTGVGRAQALITEQTLEEFRDSLALVIGLMGQRFGSSTGTHQSGTEEEFEWALKSHQETDFPEIKFFFRDVREFVSPSDSAKLQEAVEQWEKVQAFRGRVRDQLFYKTFDDLAHFKEILSNDLSIWLADPARRWHGASETDFSTVSSADSSAELPQHTPIRDIEELRLAYENTSESRRPCEGATIDFVDWNLVEQYARRFEPSLSLDADREGILSELRLFTPLSSSNINTLHNAAALCFCRRPEKFMPSARSVLVVGDPSEPTFSRTDVTGPLSVQVSRLVELTMGSLATLSSFGPEGLRRDVAEIPIAVVRELISNAISHRDYYASGTVQVNITADELEIISPGSFPNGMSWDSFVTETTYSYSYPNDEAIVLYLSNLLVFEGVGRGFSVVRRYLEEEGADSIKCEELPGPAICVRVRRPKPTLPEHQVRALSREAISLARLPSTSADVFGRDKELAALDDAWTNPNTNVIGLVAWGGVGKTALVNKWLLQMGADDYRSAQRVYGWSFYSQGAAEGRQASADLFIATALRDFGDPKPDEGSPWDKGERLANLVRQQRTLLVLDGMEPLQHPPTEGVREGQLKDPALQSLLRALARLNPGLCVISTRLPVDDLKEFQGTTYESIDLEDLSPEAGLQLLRSLGVDGTPDELKEAVDEYEGHALALSLLGRYLVTVYHGDIRQRDKIARLTGERRQGGHARRVIESYAEWFKGKPELSILHILGLSDRPVDEGALRALLARPAIEGLTSDLVEMSQEDWQYSLANLRQARLLADEDRDSPDTLDAHPLVREHFGESLQETNPGSWKEAHGRLYEHYKAQAPELPETLEEMVPLFAAVAHGCHAGRHQQAFDEVYYPRILRDSHIRFSVGQLGAIGTDLEALSGFFDPPWRRPVAGLTEHTRSFVLGEAGLRLRALGRLDEAIQPLSAGLESNIGLEGWGSASGGAYNLSELHLTIGELPRALDYAEQGVRLADQSDDAFLRMASRATLADALHQAGRSQEAETLFQEAEAIQEVDQPRFPFLYALRGFQYCDLLLSQGRYREVQWVDQTLNWGKSQGFLLDIALGHLSLGRAQLLEMLQENGDFPRTAEHLDQAVDGLRQAGQQDELPRGLLARAVLHRVRGDFAAAQRDLDETMSIAQRGGMRLHEADAHLEYARLHLAMGETDEARERLATAKTMIDDMGYHRRDPEVEDLADKLTNA
jgi:tetratricopeptide (TPR) repeat protein